MLRQDATVVAPAVNDGASWLKSGEDGRAPLVGIEWGPAVWRQRTLVHCPQRWLTNAASLVLMVTVVGPVA